MIQLQQILVPTDFSEFSSIAVDYACAMADKFAARLHVLHVIEVHASSTPFFVGGLSLNSYVRESREAAENKLREVARDRDAVRCLADGPAFLEILRYAKEHEIDMIVMGTHGRSGLEHVLLGSVAERIVRKAACPVMTIRHPKHRFVMPFDKVV